VQYGIILLNRAHKPNHRCKNIYEQSTKRCKDKQISHPCCFLRGRRLGAKDQTNDQAVQTQSLSKDKNKNHADEQLGLLSGSANTSITNDADGHAGSQTSQTDREARSQMGKTIESAVAIRADCRVERLVQRLTNRQKKTYSWWQQ
jgi:hypothetical protein